MSFSKNSQLMLAILIPVCGTLSTGCTNVVPEFYRSQVASQSSLITTKPSVSFDRDQLRFDELSEKIFLPISLDKTSLLETEIEIDLKSVDGVDTAAQYNIDLPIRTIVAPGQTHKIIMVNFRDDSNPSTSHYDDTFELKISKVTNGNIGAGNTIEVILRDNDYCGDVRSSNSPFANSGDGGNGIRVPFTICTAAQLIELMTQEPLYSRRFLLKADIDMSGIDGSTYEGIGNSTNSFSGQFDGNQFTIKGLYIKRESQENVGFFGVIGSSGIVKDLKVEVNKVEGGTSVGVVAGKNQGLIERVGVVPTTSDDPKVCSFSNIVGGLVGENLGIIRDSYSKMKVESGGFTIGGLAGISYGPTSLIERSYASGDISSTSNNAGGLVGSATMGTTIRSSYSFGNVTAYDNTNSSIGAFVGYTDGDPTNIINPMIGPEVTCNNSGGVCNGLADFLPSLTANQSISRLIRWDFYGSSKDGMLDTWRHTDNLPELNRPSDDQSVAKGEPEQSGEPTNSAPP